MKIIFIFRAANSKEAYLLQLLYKKGNLTTNDLLQQDEYGSTPLHFAAVRNSSEAVQFILSHGGNPLLTNNNQKKPSDVTSDEQIRQKLIAKENALIEKKLQEKARQSKELAAPLAQSKKLNSKLIPSSKRSTQVSAMIMAKQKGGVNNSKSNIPAASNVSESSSSLKKPKLKTFVAATAR